MKYLILISMILLLACSNPANIQMSPIEYFIYYEYSSVGGIESYATYYNPETNQSQNSGSTGDYYCTLEMKAYSSQNLWMITTSTDMLTVFIRVDGVIVAESVAMDSVYIEYLLP